MSECDHEVKSKDMAYGKDIAVVGYSCRLPGGVAGPDDFWDLLISGRDAVTQIPEDRWDPAFFHHPDPAVPGRAGTFKAGVLDEVAAFDADFFGISPREAEQMDPQQRLLLELAWEALESGGQVPSRLAGSPCAVYVGIASTDYADVRQGDPAGANAHFMLGSVNSIAANRISYLFDLRGPSMAIDTACSSALVALYEAVHAIREKRASLALVGAINLLLSPFPFIGFTKASMLSDYGRCRAFDKLAKGYVRAEGGGVVFLKPLADAKRDGDPIHAVIKGVGVNSDGRTRGIALPSSEAQEALLRDLYAEAGVDPADLVYFEAHGTGTEVGDPAEAGSIGRALGTRRPTGVPLPVGSVKTNIGHLETSSGMAGLIKAIEVVKRGVIPPSLHAAEPNPEIDFEALNLTVAREAAPLPETQKPALVGVNSFGFGGANAHAIVQQYRGKSRKRASRNRRGDLAPLILTARAEPALRALAGRYARELRAEDAAAYPDLAYSAAFRREHHGHRLVARASGLEDLAERLQAFADDEAPEGLVSGQEVCQAPKTALVFSGNGAQWCGMGLSLLEEDEITLGVFGEIDALVRETGGWSPLAELQADEERTRLADTRIAQPLLFALQLSMLESLRRRGLRADAVTGHSVGEVSAACACGALDLEQGVQVILCRSTMQDKTRGAGRMAAADIDPERALAEMERYGGAIELAAVNGPGAVTLCGEEAALAELGERLGAEEISYQILDLDYAFHNRVLDPHRNAFLDSLSDLSPGAAEIPFVSSVRGEALDGGALDAGYWWDNARQPVQFEAAISALGRDGHGVFVEVGPHPIMQGYIRRTLGAIDRPGLPIVTMSQRESGLSAIQRAVDQAFVSGGALDLARLVPDGGRFAPLPAYPWQHERYWAEATSEAEGPLYARSDGPFLGRRLVRDVPLWEGLVDTKLFPFLEDHQVGGGALFPAAGFVETALEAGSCLHPDKPIEISGLEIRRPLALDGGESRSLRLHHDPEEGSIRIESRAYLSGDPWTVNAVGRLAAAAGRLPALPRNLAANGAGQACAPAALYDFAGRLGIDYGPAFQPVEEIAVAGSSGWATLAIPEAAPGAGPFRLHPVLLDGCLQGVFAVMLPQDRPEETASYLPQRLERLLLHQPGKAVRHCAIKLHRVTRQALTASFDLYDEDHELVAQMRGFRFQRAYLLARRRAEAAHYRAEVVPLPLSSSERAPLDWDPERLLAGLDDPPSDSLGPLLDRLAAAYARRALRSVSLEEFAGGADDGQAAGDGRADLRRLGLFMSCSELAESRTLAPAAGETEEDPDTAWRRLLARRPDALAELTLLGRAGRQLAKRLRSRETAPARPGPAILESFHAASPTAAPALSGLLAALEDLLSRAPAHRRIRILEIGSNGLLARQLLPRLPKDRIALTLADAETGAPSFIAAERNAGPDPQAKTLDLGAPLDAEAGWRPGSFEAVIGLRGLGDPQLTPEALKTLGSLLTPDGLLLLAAPRGRPWFDLAFGAEESWWRLDEREGLPLPRIASSEDDWLSLMDAAALGSPAARALGGFVLAAARTPQEQDQGAGTAGGENLIAVICGKDSGPESALGAALGAALRASGAQVLSVHPGCETLRRTDDRLELADDEAWQELTRDLAARSGSATLVYLNGLGFAEQPAMQTAAGRCLPALALARALAAAGLPRAPRLVLVTRGAHMVPAALAAEAPFRPGEAPLVGLARVLQNELPDAAVRLIDLHAPEADPEEVPAALAEEILNPDEEGEVILGADRRLGLRLRALPPPSEGRANGPDHQRSLTFTPGSLDNLAWSESERGPLAPGEVEIEVRAAGLNFRDVMFAMGLLPSEALENGFAGATLGMEAAGTVARVGEEASGFKPGDPVFCFAPACFADYARSDQGAVRHMPDGMDFAQAATIPTTFFTVCYALSHLARLAPGERILIHGAAGGVGLAAIQFARHLGAEIFATAGTDEKRDFVRLMGVPEDHVFDSRSTAFADEVMAATGGEGIDVALNSLAGEAIRKGLECLRPLGRFIELGKRDFYLDSKLGLRPFHKNISYFGVDADQLMVERPALAREILDQVIGLFREGVLSPLPHRLFRRDEIVEAFRTMQQSRHMGKIVVTMDESPADSRPRAEEEAPPSADLLRSDARYLVTGGLGGFGLATADWLAERGAKHLVLVSRKGQAEGDAQAVIEKIESRGTAVEARACDVSDPEQVAALVEALRRDGPPLKGVIHAAALFEDSLVANLDDARFQRVLAPKVAGAEALDAATRDLTLDFFVLYASVTTQFGNPGQANYVAANAYLEALAQARRARGQPAVAVSWGAIADAGYLAREEGVLEDLETRLGVAAMSAGEALAHLEGLIGGAEGPAVAVVALDRGKLKGRLPALKANKFAELVAGHGEEDSQLEGLDLMALLEELEPAEVRELVLGALVEEVAKVLRLPAERVDPKKSIFDMGMDSLMVLELTMALEEQLGVKLPAIAQADDTSLSNLADRILHHVTQRRATTVGLDEAAASDLLGHHGESLDEEEIRKVVRGAGEESESNRFIA